MNCEISPRCSGRTTRMMLQAIDRAKTTGLGVLVVFATAEQAQQWRGMVPPGINVKCVHHSDNVLLGARNYFVDHALVHEHMSHLWLRLGAPNHAPVNAQVLMSGQELELAMAQEDRNSAEQAKEPTPTCTSHQEACTCYGCVVWRHLKLDGPTPHDKGPECPRSDPAPKVPGVALTSTGLPQERPQEPYDVVLNGHPRGCQCDGCI